jgi:CRP/FNR family transcriptional regulator, cyclic AMP receptor protein
LITPVAVLKRIPLFTSLAETDLANLAVLLRRKGLAKGETLFRQGDEGTALYIILEGKIKISLSRRTDTVTLALLGEGEFLGEMALLDGLPRSADAAAQEDSQVYVLNRRDFLSFLTNNEDAVRAILSALSLRLRKTDKQLAEMCFLNLSVRLAGKLIEMAEAQAPAHKEYPGHSLKISQKELGDILGVSRESVNKELKNLRIKGILTTSRGRIFIHDLATLQKRLL